MEMFQRKFLYLVCELNLILMQIESSLKCEVVFLLWDLEFLMYVFRKLILKTLEDKSVEKNICYFLFGAYSFFKGYENEGK